jgi:hypothetical protein
MYPITQEEFDFWVDVLQSHFPTHPMLEELGGRFKPCTPEEAEAEHAAHARAHPVGEMRDQDGARRGDPDAKDVVDWIDMMKTGDVLLLSRRDGGMLKFWLDRSGYAAECLDPTGDLQGRAAALAVQTVDELGRRYVRGDVAGCVSRLSAAVDGDS